MHLFLELLIRIHSVLFESVSGEVQNEEDIMDSIDCHARDIPSAMVDIRERKRGRKGPGLYPQCVCPYPAGTGCSRDDNSKR